MVAPPTQGLSIPPVFCHFFYAYGPTDAWKSFISDKIRPMLLFQSW